MGEVELVRHDPPRVIEEREVEKKREHAESRVGRIRRRCCISARMVVGVREYVSVMVMVRMNRS